MAGKLHGRWSRPAVDLVGGFGLWRPSRATRSGRVCDGPVERAVRAGRAAEGRVRACRGTTIGRIRAPAARARRWIARASSGSCSHANPMLWPLAICSIVTLGYVLERFAALRRERVIPHEFVDRFLERLSSGKLDRERALELCRAHESPAARIFALVVNAWGQPGADDPADRQSRRRG